MRKYYITTIVLLNVIAWAIVVGGIMDLKRDYANSMEIIEDHDQWIKDNRKKETVVEVHNQVNVKVDIEQDGDALTSGQVELVEVQTSASTDQQIVDYIYEVFGSDAKMAVAIAKAESNLDASREGDQHIRFEKNGIIYGSSWGVFQIRYLEGRPSPEKLLYWKFNIEEAKRMFDRKGGWSDWSAYNNGRYLEFI